MRTLNFIILLLISVASFSQRTYINSDIDDFVNTNEKYFCVPINDQNKALTLSQLDFYSTIRFSKIMTEVSKNGKTQNISGVEVSRVYFATENTDVLIGDFIKKMKMIVLKPSTNFGKKRPCILISIGGANANEISFPLLTTVTHYLMKGYVVAYYENPNTYRNDQEFYLSTKGVIDTIPNKNLPYISSLYFGVQIGTAATKYIAFNAVKYNVDPHQLYAMGLSYGAFISNLVALGQKETYYDGQNLKYPFNKFGRPDRFLTQAMRDAPHTIKGVSLWAGAYPNTTKNYFNPFGDHLDVSDRNKKVIHFHGLLDDQISYKDGWLNGLVNYSLFCDGPALIDQRMKELGIPSKSYINCVGGHGVVDNYLAKFDITTSLNPIFETFNFNDIPKSYLENKIKVDSIYHMFEQGSNLADTTVLFFNDKLIGLPSLNFITPKSDTNGHYMKSDCSDLTYCIENLNFIGSPCDDNNKCTVNDKIGEACICSGVFQDSDGDGTCDAQDICNEKPEPNSPCDDNNICTVNDKIGESCICSGEVQDSDGDGTCDAQDICNGSAEPGTPCDDNDPETIMDTINLQCICQGKGISDIEDSQLPIKVFPNPTIDYIKIENYHLIEKLWLIHTTSKISHTLKSNYIINFDEFDLPAGVYWLGIEMIDGKLAYIKIVLL
jgi:hypothetical protein